jgi:hypothetical protein
VERDEQNRRWQPLFVDAEGPVNAIAPMVYPLRTHNKSDSAYWTPQFQADTALDHHLLHEA